VSAEVTATLISASSALVVAGVTATAAIYASRIVIRLDHQVALRTAEQRMASYARLWQMTAVASPSRQAPISAVERQQLYDDINLSWYYEQGNGMVLTEPTRTLLLHALDNLVCPDDELFPASLVANVPTNPAEREQWRGELSQDQLSLLRTQMRCDLAIFGRVYAGALLPRDVSFLRACGVNPDREPWRASRMVGTHDDVGALGLSHLPDTRHQRHSAVPPRGSLVRRPSPNTSAGPRRGPSAAPKGCLVTL